MKHRFTQEEVNFIKEHYPHHGAQFCAEHLKIDTIKIQKKAGDGLKLRVLPEVRSKILEKNYYANHPQLDPLLESKLFTEWPDVWIYLLGYIWADGHLEKGSYRVNLKVQEEDGQYIIKLIQNNSILSFISYKFQKKQKESWKNTIEFRFSDKNIYKKLEEYNYCDKSLKTASILNIIPQNKKFLWFLGFHDGDGHISTIKRKKINSIGLFSGKVQLAGSYDADWTDIFGHLTNAGILNIKKRFHINKTHKGSSLNIRDIDNVIKYINFIYQNKEMGLPRKIKISTAISSMRKNHTYNILCKYSIEELKKIRKLENVSYKK